MEAVYLYGASGHAKVVMDILKKVCIKVPCLIDDNPRVNELAGLPVVHSAEGFSPIIVAIGDCQVRRKIVNGLDDRRFLTVIHPQAIVADNVLIGCGTVVMAGAILNPYIRVGNHCIINTGASLDHDVKIEDYVHIAPHCTLCGGVEVEDGTWIGAGSTVMQRIHFGRNCFIGAGSVVVKDIPDGSPCYGNPARVINKFNKNADNKCHSSLMGGSKVVLPIYAAFYNYAA